MQRERMSKKKSSQVHCISSHDHILMMASTSKHIPEIRLYKAWKKFFLWWGLTFGPDVNSLFLASFLIGAPALTFCIRMLVWIQKDDPIFNYTVLTSAFILTLLKRGLLKNVKEVLFAKILPSQLDLRAMDPKKMMDLRMSQSTAHPSDIITKWEARSLKGRVRRSFLCPHVT
ncbi:unnamed protein product [Brassica rapa subsp. trilocularis]